jgi:hypothetical protein
MKRTRFFISSAVLLLFISTSTVAQQTVALHSNGTVTFFQNSNGFTNSVAAAADGDTIYLSGGIFPVSNLLIGKKLTIFGVGYSPDNNTATGITQINGNIFLVTGADHSFISGLFVNGDVMVGNINANQKVSHVIIKRCHIAGSLQLTHDGDTEKMGSGFLLEENIIRILNGQHIRNCMIRQNVIGRLYYFRDNNQFINNIILRTSEYFAWGYSSINGSHFENNIFTSLAYTNVETGGFSNCTFHQNVFIPNTVFGTSNSTGAYQNLSNIDINSVFVNYDGAIVFSFNHDFTLKEGFAGKGFGKDGFDVGIYGSSVPFKANMLPQIPHIKTQTIAPSTNQEGKLQIKIEVEAQER